MALLKEALKRLVNVQKESMEKELKAIERMKKAAEAVKKEAIHTKVTKG